MSYNTAKIHSDIFNTFVDIVRQKLSTLADFWPKLNTEKTMVKDPNLLRTGLPRLF